ncbi:uncharacterized protein VTP21DRAFT_2687 [Calcarisporiella thermophila]|uniref:uncharacterized protein n=1 Tax=Calcarisporiella thermophila TaxID=911321 RepID=UPI0037438FF6
MEHIDETNAPSENTQEVRQSVVEKAVHRDDENNIDIDDDAIFEELEKEEAEDDALAEIRERRIQQLRNEMETLQEMRKNEHGIYTEIPHEKEIMSLTTTIKNCILQFSHKDFRRCAILDKHLHDLAKKHFTTKFMKINVENAPFLVEKLKIQVLPCILCFVDGVVVDRLIGFEELGNTDSFTTDMLEKRLAKSGVIKRRTQSHTSQVKKSIFGSKTPDEEEDDDY